MDVSQLEPADRDPKKLRATAFKIVLFMILSGGAILYAYVKYQERTVVSDRPSLLSKITEPEVELLTTDGKYRNLQELKGNVTLGLILTTEVMGQSAPSLEALRTVMEEFKDAPQKPTILVFVLDGSNTEPEKMSTVLAEYGSEPEVIRVVTSEDRKDSLRSFLKTKMRFNIVPSGQDGDYKYDSSLVLLDQHLHVRGHPGASEGWDFALVDKHEKLFAEAKEEHPDKELKPVPISKEKLTQMLVDAIKYLYENPDEKAQG